MSASVVNTSDTKPISFKTSHPHHAWRMPHLSPIATVMRRSIEQSTFPAPLPSFHSVTSGVVTKVILNTPDSHDETIKEIADRVITAKHSLLLQTYIFKADSEAAIDLFKAIAQAQCTQPSLRCVIAYNALMSTSKVEIEKIALQHGARIILVPHEQGLSRRSLHSKTAIIDGLSAIIGGSNVDNPAETDIAIELQGSVVKALVLEFRTLLHEARTMARKRKNQSSTLLSKDEESSIFSDLPTPSLDMAEIPMLVLTKTGINWRGPYYEQPHNAALLKSIRAAEHEICIRSPNVNDVCLLAALAQAARRGVNVHLLLPKGYLQWQSIIDSAGNYAPLIYKAQRLTPAAQKKFLIRWHSDDGIATSPSHAKLYIIDGIPIIGSQNADNQSFCFSREVSVALCSPQHAQEIRRVCFDEQWQKGIPVRMRWIHHLLPIPAFSWQRRISRISQLPFIIWRNWKNFLARATSVDE